MQAGEMGWQKPHEVQQNQMQSLDIWDETALCNNTDCRKQQRATASWAVLARRQPAGPGMCSPLFATCETTSVVLCPVWDSHL